MKVEEMLEEQKLGTKKKCILCKKGKLKYMGNDLYRCPECLNWFKARDHELDVFVRPIKKVKNKIIRKEVAL